MLTASRYAAEQYALAYDLSLDSFLAGYEPYGLTALWVTGVLPPAVLNYIVAERYGQEPETVAAIVIWGNLASLAVIPLTLAAIL